MRRKLSWVAFTTLAAVFLACGHSSKVPTGPEASAVTLDAALGNKFVKANASGAMVARIGLAAKKRSTAARPPVNLALLVDTSGSMEGKAIADARAASLALVSSLAPRTASRSSSWTRRPRSSSLDAPRRRRREGTPKKIAAMKATGTTDMAAGLHMAIDEVTKNLQHDGVNRVVLVGDGVPNDDRQILPLVAQASSRASRSRRSASATTTTRR